MPLITIQENCIRCQRCVKVCPSRIFQSDTSDHSITMAHPETCISCGHCVMACENKAVRHSLFPLESLHPIDRSQIPTPDQMELLCRARRSNRTFTKREIPQDVLDRLVALALVAPTASNSRNVEVTVLRDPEQIRHLSRFTFGAFGRMLGIADFPLLRPIFARMIPGVSQYIRSFKEMRMKFDQGKDEIVRDAPVVLLFHTSKGSRFGSADANLAYQNASLMAESMGLSQLYLGFVCMAIRMKKHPKVLKDLGIEGEVHAAMGIGYPAFLYPYFMVRGEDKN